MIEISADILSAADSVDDAEVRRQGIGFIDSSIPGYALLLGDDAANAPAVVESLTRKNIVVFVTADALAESLREAGVSLGWKSRVVPLDVTSALGFITRVAQIFGNADTPEAALDYARERLRGFSLLLGQPTAERLKTARDVAQFGCPLLSSAELEPGADWEAAVIGGLALDDLVQAGIEERGLRVYVPLPELPVKYSEDFAGEIVRDDKAGAALYGAELVVTGQNLVDGRVIIAGPDLDASLTGDHPYGLLVEVSGRAMQPDFENVLEREIETLLNEVNGLMHRGQRANSSLRVSQKAIDAGLRLRHLGEILHARYHNEFGNILSRVQVTIITDPEQAHTLAERAQAVYDRRDARLSGMTDDEVDTFYTCTLCQTIASSHICIISPEHVGVCGAMDWMDAQAAVSIRPVGPNQAVKKEGLLDARLGQWESVNLVAQKETGGALESYSLYSMMEAPGPACGDFDCITAMLPLSNGVMVMSSAYEGRTPSGMDWAMLYEMVGAGMSIPGFIGHSKRALGSRKFIAGDGGWRRIVWMDHALREELRPVLEALADEAGITGFVDMIATEQEATSEDEVLAHIGAAGHPALAMEPMI